MVGPLQFNLEPDEVDIFLQDVNEHIQMLETDLLQLEQAADREVYDAVSRAAHTLKAVAATIGHDRMADLTHALETLIDRCVLLGLPRPWQPSMSCWRWWMRLRRCGTK